VELIRLQQIVRLASLIRSARSRAPATLNLDSQSAPILNPQPKSMSLPEARQVHHALLAEAWALLDKLDAALDAWGQLWRVPRLSQIVRYEFSRRLRSSLGRCHPETGKLQLNQQLLTVHNRARLVETFCHQAAQIAVWHLYGTGARPRGPEWQELIAQARYPLSIATSSRPIRNSDPRSPAPLSSARADLPGANPSGRRIKEPPSSLSDSTGMEPQGHITPRKFPRRPPRQGR
jgi:hypothetical protein